MLIFKFRTMCCAAVLAIAAGGPTSALIAIESSDAPGIQIDAEFPDNHVFDVPAGATVKLIKTPGKNPEGDTHTIKGRYRGTLDDFIRRECWRPGASCAPSNEMGGGTKGLTPGVGGVRSAPPQN